MLWMCDLLCGFHMQHPAIPRDSKKLWIFAFLLNKESTSVFSLSPQTSSKDTTGKCRNTQQKKLTGASVTKKIPCSIPMNTNLALKTLVKFWHVNIWRFRIFQFASSQIMFKPALNFFTKQETKELTFILCIYKYKYHFIYAIPSYDFQWRKTLLQMRQTTLRPHFCIFFDRQVFSCCASSLPFQNTIPPMGVPSNILLKSGVLWVWCENVWLLGTK